MVKVNNAKAETKINDNQRTFVKNRGGFHPSRGDLKEKAYLRSLTAVEEETDPSKEYNPYRSRAEDPDQKSPASYMDRVKDSMEMVVYGGVGYLMKAIDRVLPPR